MSPPPVGKIVARPVARDLGLLLILILGAGLRLLYIDLPLADAHSWRQIENTTIARSFAEGPFDLLHPQVNWGGPGDASVEMEFPLLPAMIAGTYLVFGEHESLARLIVVGFSVGTIAVIYLLGRRLFGPPVGRAAAFLAAISPSMVYFGRSVIVDTPMVCFSALALLGYVAYFQTGRRRLAVWAGLAAGLAWLVKIPSLLIAGPIVYAGWRAKRLSLIRDRWFILSFSAAFAVTLLWYWHAFGLYQQTGLTFGLWHPAGEHPVELAAYASESTTYSQWRNSLEFLRTGDFFQTLLGRFWVLHLTPTGLTLAVVGLAIGWRRPGSGIVYVWVAAATSFLLVAAEGNYLHEYYQLVLLPPLTLFFGLVAAPLFDGVWIRERLGTRGWVTVVPTVVLLGLLSFWLSGVIRHYFRPHNLDMTPIVFGALIDQTVGPDALLVATEYPEGSNSPILLYNARRQGWSFDGRSLSPHLLDYLLSRGGDIYFATTIWAEVEELKPDVVAYLRRHRLVPLEGAPPNTRLIALR